MSVKIGQRVEIAGKDCQGVIAYVGHPAFAAGKWIGVILDEPKGRNNGTIKGQFYFKCPDNHGMFVRQTQLIMLDDAGNRQDSASPALSASASGQTTPDEVGASRARSRLTTAAVRQRNQPTAVRRKTSPAKVIQHTEKLSGSRLSLSGSRTQLKAPSTENLSTTSGYERKDAGESHIPAPMTVIKRASFIEKNPSTSAASSKKSKTSEEHDNTGFVENLKPQFVPGQAIGPSAISNTMEEKLSLLQAQQENDNLKAQIKDLNERIEVLRVKRMQDKDKMKEFEKVRLQCEQLIEFKNKVMETQASLQRDLQRARQEARDAHAAREQYQDEMADLSETVEMATLDKEMAEEKAETLQIELEQLKEKLEEQSLDLEILRNEMSEKMGSGGVRENATSFEVKQLEQQNTRLRETLVRMRDLSAHEKHEFQKLQKDLEQKKSEILELSRTKEKLSARVEEMEHQIADLQEQVDAAMGAEEMIEVLGERKIALEEKVAKLEEEVSDLEALQDTTDQLLESSKELELELREELDMALSAAREAQRQRDAALETLSDRELTISKFRELTQKLQVQCIELQEKLQSTGGVKGQTGQQLAEILDFQKTFAESRAQTKAVDLELRRLDAEEARAHVNYLLSFMPPAFMSRGGDHDAILTLLLIPRTIQKTDIVVSQVRDKYKLVEKVDRASVLKGHAVAQAAFSSRLAAHMYSLQTSLGCFDSALKACSTENLLKLGSAYPEIAAQEKAVDSLIELAKRDQLDENLAMEAIERCCAYFFTLYGVYFGEEDFANQAKLVYNGTKCIGSACEAIRVEAAALKTLIDGEPGDMGLLCQHIELTCNSIEQNLKSARRRVPRDSLNASTPNEAHLGLEQHWFEQIQNCYDHAVKLMRTLHDLVKSTLQAVQSSGASMEQEKGLSSPRMKEMAAASTEKVYESDDIGAIATIKASLGVIQKTASNLSERMSECENELAMSSTSASQKKLSNAEETSPISIRAQAARKELEETKILTRKLEAKDSDIRESKLALREKQEELSEMILRKELAEKRLATQQHEHELAIEKLKRNLEEVQTQLRRKEKEFEETMDHLQTDIDSLESERGQLKEKLKSIGKKGGVPSTPGSENLPSFASSGTPMLEGALHDKLEALREALRDESRQKRNLLADSLQRKLNALPVLPKLDMKPDDDPKVKELVEKKTELLREAKKLTFFPVVPDLTRKKLLLATDEPILEKALPVYQLLEREQNLRNLKNRVDELSNQVREETIKRTFGGQAEAEFAVFPSRHVAAALKNSKEPVTAEIIIPRKGPSQIINMPVGTQELRKVHMLLSY
ncbi:hypothetical protein TKK_0014946 [Trichogramma kaykai]|uniref:Dynactin subunit 1 n=1 Tax=Trichogramma kaykai TaxID=54128 RepID=A0ABD2WC65_9HYME